MSNNVEMNNRNVHISKKKVSLELLIQTCASSVQILAEEGNLLSLKELSDRAETVCVSVLVEPGRVLPAATNQPPPRQMRQLQLREVKG